MVVKSKFNKEIFPHASVPEGLNELTLQEGQVGTLNSFRHHKCGYQQMGTTVLQGCGGSGMGELVLQVCGCEQGSQCSHSYATKIERWEEVRQELWRTHLESPTFALSQALRKVETWEDVDSLAGGSRS